MPDRTNPTGRRAPIVALAAIAGAVVFATAVAIALAPTAAAKPTSFTIASSTFDADADGWTIDGEAIGPDYHTTGGRPAGYVSATDPQGTTGTSYWRAPAKFLGDASAALSTRFTYEMRDTGPGSVFGDPDVVLGGSTVTVAYRHRRRPSAKKWKRFTVVLNGKSRWTNTATGRRPTAAEFRSVLASLDMLRIRGELRNGPETFDLDNVVLRGRSK